MSQDSTGRDDSPHRNDPLWHEAPGAPADAPRLAPAGAALAGQAPGWERDVLEKLAFASLKEQRAARRWKIFFRLAWLLVWVGLVWAFVQAASGVGGKTGEGLRQHTAVIEIDGEIGANTESSAVNINAGLKRAFEDRNAKAVVLWINSPGGSPVQAGIVHDEIRRLKALHKKPVYAVVQDLCASAAYYIAAGADDIYVDKASMVGSIGVLMNGFGFTELMQKIGVERRLQTAGVNKGMLDPFSPQNTEQKAHVQAMLDQIHQQFIKVVREGRGDRLKENNETFSGLVWTGEQAVQNGLADQLGDISYVAREVVKADELVDYTERASVSDRLVRRLGASFAGEAVNALLQTYSLR
ncbi:MAG: putative signal peptide peptidase SppA [Paracidovorax wautersii]|uniref:Putative signal peptide peptidase SppA n=1 Tax=Paracidovorax wautersii TaxID=1177982 RepID=A0A7V8FQ10_9BURK|nr:MAG: putative signal peptide peptidase SppA [Paracidovorax wautersii]